jgi:hypothetical protein
MADENQDKDRQLLIDTRAQGVESLANLLALLNRAKQFAPGAPDETKGLLFDAARTSVDDYLRWVKLGTRGFDILLDSLQGPHGIGAAHHGHKPSPVSVRLKLRSGESGSAQFVVANHRGHKIEVLFTKPNLQTADGKHHLPDVTFGPSNEFVIDSKKSARFCVDLALGDDAEAGHYHGDAAIVARHIDTGHLSIAGRLLIDVHVRALPAVMVNVEVTEGSGQAQFEITNPLPQTASILFAVPVRWSPAPPSGVAPVVAFSGAGTTAGIEAGKTGPFTVSVTNGGHPGAQYGGTSAVLANGQLIAQLKLSVEAHRTGRKL